MRGADASAGTIKSGGKTRRAAKMVILNVDHPDVEEFIWCKARRGAQGPRPRATPASTWTSTASDSHSIQYQNANNSVRVTDEFMQAVVDDADWHLRAVTDRRDRQDGQGPRPHAPDLRRRRGSAPTPACSSTPRSTAGTPRPTPAASTASNPCSEYMHLDNSACNLASINLLKFLDDDDSFDVEGFKHAVEVDVHRARRSSSATPTTRPRRSARTAGAFRQLGLGYANLGALLMALGLPYDSDDGRAWAGAHHRADDRPRLRHLAPAPPAAWARSPATPRTREHMLNVLRMHRGRGGQDRRGARARRPARRRAAGVGRRRRARRGVRRAQLAGHGARAHRHDRPDDGLRHHRHRARPRPHARRRSSSAAARC